MTFPIRPETTREWNISIIETDDTLEARITNMDTGESLKPFIIDKNAYTDGPKWSGRDEAVGDLFVAVTDSFDSV